MKQNSYNLFRFGRAHRESALKHSRDFAIRRAAKKKSEQSGTDTPAESNTIAKSMRYKKKLENTSKLRDTKKLRTTVIKK